MRSTRSMRTLRPGHVAAGALMLVIPSSAVALAAGQADAQSAVTVDTSRSQIGYGQKDTITGTAPATDAGQPAALQFARTGSGSWQTLSTTRIGAGGRFRFRAPVRESGSLRALVPGASDPRTAGSGGAAPASAGTASTPWTIRVGSRLQVPARTVAVLGGQSFTVGGRLLPGVRGRIVRLQGRTGSHWHALASSRTGNRGGFMLRAHAGSGERLRVVFRGDRGNTGSNSPAGRVTVFHQSLASWYNDAGSTACGFHAGLGVANKSLPCGTKVTFQYGGRTVTAVVDDRGPYVGGREWDLNQNTAHALGFGGVGAVWTSL